MNTSFTTDQERWDKLDIFNQMGNIYSEVGRSFKAKNAGVIKDQQEAVSRAIDLFDATVESLLSQKSPRIKEVLRAKEQFLDSIYSAKIGDVETQKLDRYFLQFALAARLHH
jgi:hypothetical protein